MGYSRSMNCIPRSSPGAVLFIIQNVGDCRTPAKRRLGIQQAHLGAVIPTGSPRSGQTQHCVESNYLTTLLLWDSSTR